MKVVAFGSAAEAKGKQTRHSSGKTIFDIADIVVDTCAPAEDASVQIRDHQDKLGPVSTMAFVACVWMTVITVAEILVERGVKLYIHPSHNVPGDTTAKQRLEDALAQARTPLEGRSGPCQGSRSPPQGVRGSRQDRAGESDRAGTRRCYRRGQGRGISRTTRRPARIGCHQARCTRHLGQER